MKYTLAILFFIFFTSASFAAPMAGAGKIWDRNGQEFISEKTLMTRLARAHNILMGLQAGNPAHYRLAAQIITDMARAGRKPVILLGNIERNKQNAFAIFSRRYEKSSKTYDATGLDMLLDWTNGGYSDWAVARPVFDAAMVRKLPLRAVAFSRYEIGRLHDAGVDGLPDDVRDGLLPLLRTPLPDKVKTRLMAKISAAYCADLPPDVIARLTLIDRAQNGMVALAIKKTDQKTILVAPRKNILHDSGIPRYLKMLAVKDKTVSLLFSEFTQKLENPEVDYVWFTNRIPQPDPCRFLNMPQGQAP